MVESVIESKPEAEKPDPHAAVRNFIMETYSAGRREWPSPTLRELTGHPDYPPREDEDTDRAYVRRCRESQRRAGFALKEALREILRDHKIDVQPVGKSVYRAIESADQIPRAMRDVRRGVRAAIDDGADRVAHTRVETAAEAQKRTDALIRLDTLRAMFRKSDGRP